MGLGSDLGDGNGQDSATPVRVDQTGVLKGKTVTAITGFADGYGHGFCVLCADGTPGVMGRGGARELGNGIDGANYGSTVPVVVDRSGVLKGKKIIAIASGMALFEEPGQ